VASEAKKAGTARPSTCDRWTNLIVVCAAIWVLCACYAVASSIAAQPPPPETAATSSSSTIWSGVFSAHQATRGELSANKNCTKCHGADLTGGQDGPSLVGPDVVGPWSSLTLGDLFDRVQTTMPADAPRSLGLQETADILAYVLSLNNCPAGEKELPPEKAALSQIRITGQPGPK
jgi:mono/diheme cytochrome c family protein